MSAENEMLPPDPSDHDSGDSVAETAFGFMCQLAAQGRTLGDATKVVAVMMGELFFQRGITNGSQRRREMMTIFATVDDALRTLHGEPPDSVIASEVLEWHDPALEKPDADVLVLLESLDAEGCPEVMPGFLDGDTWRHADAGTVQGGVLSWAHLPAGGRATLAEVEAR